MKYTEDNIVGIRFTSGRDYYKIADLKDKVLWLQKTDSKGGAAGYPYSWDSIRTFNDFVGNTFKIITEVEPELYQIY